MAYTLVDVGDKALKSTKESVDQGTVQEDAKSLAKKAVNNSWSMMSSLTSSLQGKVN